MMLYMAERNIMWNCRIWSLGSRTWHENLTIKYILVERVQYNTVYDCFKIALCTRTYIHKFISPYGRTFKFITSTDSNIITNGYFCLNFSLAFSPLFAHEEKMISEKNFTKQNSHFDKNFYEKWNIRWQYYCDTSPNRLHFLFLVCSFFSFHSKPIKTWAGNCNTCKSAPYSENKRFSFSVKLFSHRRLYLNNDIVKRRRI